MTHADLQFNFLTNFTNTSNPLLMFKRLMVLFNLCVATIAIPHLGWSLATIKGNLLIEDGYYYIVPSGTDQKLLVVGEEPHIRTRLACLKSGDFLTGTATRFNQQQVYVSSINYVGLADLVGTWRDEDEIFRFIDHKNFFYWDFSSDSSRYIGPYSFHYALSPYGENPEQCLWKIFVIDNHQVVMGSLEWSAEDQIHLQLYDPDTGEINSNKHLIRSVLKGPIKAAPSFYQF